MMTLWSLLIVFVSNLPWVAVALVAALALRRRKESTALMLQALGAAAMFVGALGQTLILHLVEWLGVLAVVHPTEIIFRFLLFVSLAAFALGFCLEHLARPRPVQVTATPA
jgi:hypothetical protein